MINENLNGGILGGGEGVLQGATLLSKAQIMGALNINDAMCGGRTDHSNYNAPKEIKSDKLISFSTAFYCEGGIGPGGNGYFMFKVQPDESGELTLKEDMKFRIECKVDASVLAGLQEIIKEFNLAQSNGVHTHTAGLPYQFETCYLIAEYDSGEKIDFSYNSNPGAKWTGAVREYLAKVFGDHGIDSMLPPKEASIIKRFGMEYTDGSMQYKYGEILVPRESKSLEDIVTNGVSEDACDRKFYYEKWDRSKGNSTSRDMVDMKPGLYEELQKCIAESWLKNFNNGELFPFSFDYQNTPEYYEFFVEYEFGNRIQGFSADPERVAVFRTVTAKIREYLNNYIG